MKSRFHVFKDMFLIKKIKIIILTHTIKIIFYLFIYLFCLEITNDLENGKKKWKLFNLKIIEKVFNYYKILKVFFSLLVKSVIPEKSTKPKVTILKAFI